MTLTFAELERIRRTDGRSMLLFLTDRCPVGCCHCSVDSRHDSPTIRDFELFGEIVEWLCGHPRLEVVGISGGEPFIERRGLSLATRRLHDAGKQLVVYTSGVWARSPEPPAWIGDVLDRAETVFLSTDAFHEEAVADGVYVNAARACAAAGCWIVVQVIHDERMLSRARALLRASFGERWEDFAELRPTQPLTAGRGADVFSPADRVPGHLFGACTMLASSTVRYDGVVTACCNERVLTGLGPRRLRRRTRSREELARAHAEFEQDPMLRAIGGAGPGALTLHPRFVDLADRKFGSICDLCWQLLERAPAEDPLVEAINGLGAPA